MKSNMSIGSGPAPGRDARLSNRNARLQPKRPISILEEEVAETPTREEPPPVPAPNARTRSANVIHRRRERVTTEQLRELKDLIRHRYSLDVELWHNRYNDNWSQYLQEEKIRKADATLVQLKRMVRDMDRRDNFETAEEYKMFKEVRDRILEKGKRNWTDNPPWKEA